MSKIFAEKNKLNLIKYNKNVNTISNSNVMYNNINELSYLKYYPSITKEWNDTIYKYERNSIKHLPSFFNTTNNIINSYLYFYDPVADIMIKNKMSRRMKIRQKRLSTNRIFLAKSYLKSTNNEININYNIFNPNKIYLLNKINKYNKLTIIAKLILLKKIEEKISNRKKQYQLLNNQINLFLSSNKSKNADFLLLLKSFNNSKRILKSLYKKRKKCINKIKIHYRKVINIFKRKIINLYYLYANILKNKENYSKEFLNTIPLLLDVIYTKYCLKLLNKEKNFYHNKQSIRFNQLKLNNESISKLEILLKKVYNNDIKINFTDLKYVYLNSNILSDYINIKLKKRKKPPLTTIRKIILNTSIYKLNRINFPYKTYRNNIFKKLNKFNLLISNIFEYKSNKDSINNILNNIYDKSFNLNSVENKKIGGIKIKISGRLSRRLTASRSITKVKSKGGLRHLRSSVDGLSCKLIRGNLSSSIQYTKINSKTRNGAYGLRIWVNNNN